MSSYVRRKSPGDLDWFVHDRFGMFIHFGLYSVAARHEWVMSREKIAQEKYDRYFKHFNPDLFDAREWARAAKAAGMKYAVLTTKHHEGFCLFDTKYTDYNIMNTPFGRDLVKEYVEAFRAEGLKVGLYYSLIDWHHPEFTIDRYHPMRDLPEAPELNKSRNMKIYTQYMRNQVEEILTNYGKIDILWLDFSYPKDEAYPQLDGGAKGKDDWESEKLIELARRLQPGIIIDNRADFEQDLNTPELYQVDEWPRHKETGELLTWEVCQTFSGSFGYNRDELTWKSPQILIEMLSKTIAFGGNLLLNVGPNGRGYFEKKAVEALNVYNEWMKYNSRSIYGCTMAEPEFKAPFGTVLTQSEDGKRLYIHILSYPFVNLPIENLAGKIDYVQFLFDGSEVEYSVGARHDSFGDLNSVNKDTVYFKLPVIKPDVVVPVIEVILK